VAVVLLGAMRQLDGALASRHPPGEVGKGVLGFPTLLSEDRVQTVREAVSAWFHATPDERFADGLALANRVIVLDVLFIIAYAVAVGVLIRRLWKTTVPEGTRVTGRVRTLMLRVAAAALIALVGVDLIEDGLALSVIDSEWAQCRDGVCAAEAGRGGASQLAIGVLAGATTVKLALAALVAILLMLTGARRVGAPHAGVFMRVRIVVVVLAALAALLLLGIGGEQSAEVIRAWNAGHATLALGAVILLATTTWGTVRFMTGQIAIAERPGGDEGRPPYVPLAVAGAALTVAGALLARFADGWSAGLAVPGVMLLVIVGLSLPIKDVLARDPGTLSQEERVKRQAEQVRIGRLWARALAAAVLFLAAFAALRAAAFEILGREVALGNLESWIYPVGFGCLCIGLGLAFMRFRGRPVNAYPAVAVICLLLAGAFALFVSPLVVGGWLGAMSVIALFFAALIALLALLTLLGTTLGDVYRLPAALAVIGLNRFPTLIFLAAWFTLASVIPFVDRGGYHDVRVLAAGGAQDVTLDDVWKRWIDHNLAGVEAGGSGSRPGVPLVLVATSGGGIRAAAWTSLALDCIFERLPAEPPDATRHCPEQEGERTETTSASDRLFAASGTSGGSLGLVEYDAALRNKDGGPAEPHDWIEERLGDDFVAPTVAGMLFRDLPRVFIGLDASDRASLLEQAWEDPWDREAAKLDDGLRESWVADPGEDEPLRPLLLLNGTSVEDRCRFMTSVIEASVQSGEHPTDDDCLRLDAYGPRAPATASGDGVLPATTELTDLLCVEQDVRMSTAALLSARFAFVSPSGRIAADECAPVADDALTYVVDGGYFDNSGAVALLDLWRTLEPLVAEENAGEGPCIVPVFVQLDNDFEAEPAPGPDARPLELLVPPAVIFGGIGSRETAARAEAAATFDRPSPLSGHRVMAGGAEIDHLWVRLSPRAHPGPQAPLGWTLSENSFTDMRHELAAEYNQPGLDVLRRVLSEDLSCEPDPAL
jgi:hypothetical protein